ncbi:hypothetical protein [Bacillus piscicola]|uniref:hypothetical protein n=1 Tax=Bacillus piscicola TaxID=1632684 RepID=UPI001F091A48|nr:hypothetical protein [Bacillus piscicola]
MKPLKALMMIVTLGIIMVVLPLLTGSHVTVINLPLNIFVLWILYLGVIPMVWFLVKKVKMEE